MMTCNLTWHEVAHDVAMRWRHMDQWDGHMWTKLAGDTWTHGKGTRG